MYDSKWEIPTNNQLLNRYPGRYFMYMICMFVDECSVITMGNNDCW